MNQPQEISRSRRKNSHVGPNADAETIPQAAGARGTLEEYKQHTIALLKQGEFNAAAGRLEKLANVEGPAAEPYAQWARAELARVQAMPTAVREKGPSLVAEAINLLAQQDYASVVALLQYVPEDYRSAEAGQVWKRAQALKDETDRLNERMTQAVRERQYDGLREKVLERLLEIQPGNLTARDIYERLGTYGPGRKLRFDKAGNLLPAHSGYWWVDKLARLVYERLTQRKYRTHRRRGPADAYLPASKDDVGSDVPLVPGVIGLGILGVAALLVGIVFLFRQGLESVRVELDPALANDASVTVWLDGKEMKIAGAGTTISLKPGEHGYEIRRGDEVLRTHEFTVLEDHETILRISGDHSSESKDAGEPPARSALVESRTREFTVRQDLRNPGASQDTSDPSKAPVAEERRAPPLAVAPFDVAEAKQHQQAWAEHLGIPVEMTNSIGMKLVLVPPGEFDMGSTPEEIDRLLTEAKEEQSAQWYVDKLPSESPRHRVRITRPFYLGKCEVTVEQFRRFVAATQYSSTAEKSGRGSVGKHPVTGRLVQRADWTWQNPGFPQADEAPVTCLSWDDATAFCQWLSTKEARAYRLATEAQWEYACRAGTTTVFAMGDEPDRLGDCAWWKPNSEGRTHPVGLKQPNPFGLFDMQGNVWEWCSDWFLNDYYSTLPSHDPPGPSLGSGRVWRGGSWADEGPSFFRSAYRHANPPGACWWHAGFRVVCEIPVTPSGKATADGAGNELWKEPNDETEEFARDATFRISPRVPQPAPAGPAASSGSASAAAPRIVAVVFPDGEAGATVKNSLGMEFVFIPPGSFMMGTPPSDPLGEPFERPLHRVTLTRPFYIGRYEVTQGEFRSVMGRNPSRGKPGPGEDTDRLPTDSVCWYDAVEFCNQLSAREGRTACYGLSNVRRAPNGTMRAADVTVRQGNGYRLPTEAEWEYACRTGTSGCRWHFGNDPSEAAKFGWFRENSSERTHPVGQKQPNAVGLYDMHGNVWEHCTDSGGLAAPGFRFTGRPRTDPLIRGTEEERIQRGGSFRWGPVRCAHRGCRYSPTTNFDDFGFRIVSDLYKPESAGVSQQRE